MWLPLPHTKYLKAGMSEHLKLDTKGLLCPMPVIRTQDAIKNLSPGDRITVAATDPGTNHDIPAWCRVHGHKVTQQYSEDQIFYFEIEVQDN